MSSNNKKCSRTVACLFFNERMAQMPATAQMLKTTYCEGGHYGECARYQVGEALGPEKVPGDLTPSQKEMVASIIAAGKK